MSTEQIDEFLNGVHVGILSIPRDGVAPHATPVWYRYASDNSIWFMAAADSVKGQLLHEGVAVSFVVQDESPPYRYVSISGRIQSVVTAEAEKDLRPLANIYLGEAGGEAYVQSYKDEGREGASNRYTIAITKISPYGF